MVELATWNVFKLVIITLYKVSEEFEGGLFGTARSPLAPYLRCLLRSQASR